MSSLPPPTAARFDGLAENYARYRPSYPTAAIEAILAGRPTPPTVLDVGAGTGIATKLLAEHGAIVVGIEPNTDMRDQAIALGCDVRRATADATGMPSGCVDVVTAFQAFHWFATDASLAEFRRVLHPGGRVAAVWNEPDPACPFANGLRAVDTKHGDRAFLVASESVDDALDGLFARNGFGRVRKLTFANEKRFDEQSLIGRQRSLSFAPREGRERDAFEADTRALFAEHASDDGNVVMHMRTDVFLAELVS